MKNLICSYLFLLFIVSCNKYELLPERDEIPSKLIQKLRCHGFNIENLDYQNGNVLVEEDIVINGNHFTDEKISEEDQLNQILSLNVTESRQYSTVSSNSASVTM